MINCSRITHLRSAHIKDLDSTTKLLMHFTNYGRGWWDFFSFWFPVVSFMIFCKTIPQIYVEQKMILNKLLIFQKNNVCAVGQRLHSPSNDQAVRILQSNIFYWLINNYKVCSDKSRTAYFNMWSSSLPDMAVRCGRVSIFSSVSSCTSPISISTMLAIFVWNL